MGKKRILVVDDEPHIAELIKATFENEPYEVLEAHDGNEALKVATKTLPDLVLLDIQMPSMDGFEVCRKLKAAKETQKIPVFIVTNRSESADKEKGSQCGADGYLTKPFSPLKLLALVKERLHS